MKELLHFKKGTLSVGAIIICILLGFFGLSLAVVGAWWGLALLFPIGVIVSIQEGVYVDVKNRKYKSYLNILWISNAKWRDIPEGTLVGIRIVKLVANRAIGPVVTGAVAYDQTMELYLYLPGPARVALVTNNNLQALYKDAKYIHETMGLEIMIDKRIPKEMYINF